MSIDDKAKEAETAEEKIEKINNFCHVYNPLHFYCRLVENGVGKEEAKKFSQMYEHLIYKPASQIILDRNIQ